VKATEVTPGLAESNGSILPGLWHDSLHVICGLTACTPGSAPGPTLGKEYGKTLPVPFLQAFNHINLLKNLGRVANQRPVTEIGDRLRRSTASSSENSRHGKTGFLLWSSASSRIEYFKIKHGMQVLAVTRPLFSCRMAI